MNKGIYKRGKSWYIDIHISGIRINRKAGNTQPEAKALVESLKAENRLNKIRQKAGLNTHESYLQKIIDKKPRSTSKVPNKIPEKYLEDYLEKNIKMLDGELKVIGRQKFIPTGRLDIVAKRIDDSIVYIELKTADSEDLGIDKICGQVSRYFNNLKSDRTKMYLIIPLTTNKRLKKIFEGLRHWIEEDRARIYQFDYAIYSKIFIFKRVMYDDLCTL